MDIHRTRIHQEFELCYKELQKAREYEINKANIPYQKLQHHDPEKWKKKLKMLLDRERLLVIDGHFAGLDLRKIGKQFKNSQSLIESVKVNRPLGTELLALAKFWVMMFELAGITKLESIESLRTVPATEENLALLRSVVEVPRNVCETNPFVLGEMPEEPAN